MMVRVCGLDRGDDFGGRLLHELDAATGGGGIVEDDILDIFHIDPARADLVENKGEHAHAVSFIAGA